jgi:hypothetical protein
MHKNVEPDTPKAAGTSTMQTLRGQSTTLGGALSNLVSWLYWQYSRWIDSLFFTKRRAHRLKVFNLASRAQADHDAARAAHEEKIRHLQKNNETIEKDAREKSLARRERIKRAFDDVLNVNVPLHATKHKSCRHFERRPKCIWFSYDQFCHLILWHSWVVQDKHRALSIKATAPCTPSHLNKF